MGHGSDVHPPIVQTKKKLMAARLVIRFQGIGYYIMEYVNDVRLTYISSIQHARDAAKFFGQFPMRNIAYVSNPH